MLGAADRGAKCFVQDRHFLGAIQPVDQKTAPRRVHIAHRPDVAAHRILVMPATGRVRAVCVLVVFVVVVMFVVGHRSSPVESSDESQDKSYSNWRFKAGSKDIFARLRLCRAPAAKPIEMDQKVFLVRTVGKNETIRPHAGDVPRIFLYATTCGRVAGGHKGACFKQPLPISSRGKPSLSPGAYACRDIPANRRYRFLR